MLRPVVVLVVVFLCAGCAPAQPIITPEPEPDVTPVFASDEEALAAATEAYANYLRVSNAIRADGGNNPERISELVSPDQLRDELSGFEALADQGYLTVGGILADTARLQQYVDGPDRHAKVVIYICLDATQVKVVDASGNPVDGSQQPRRQLFEVTMESGPQDPSTLILSRSELWSNQDDC